MCNVVISTQRHCSLSLIDVESCKASHKVVLWNMGLSSSLSLLASPSLSSFLYRMLYCGATLCFATSCCIRTSSRISCMKFRSSVILPNSSRGKFPFPMKMILRKL